MEREIQSLQSNTIYELTPQLEHVHPVHRKWVYKTKLPADGSIKRPKAIRCKRLLAETWPGLRGNLVTGHILLCFPFSPRFGRILWLAHPWSRFHHCVPQLSRRPSDLHVANRRFRRSQKAKSSPPSEEGAVWAPSIREVLEPRSRRRTTEVRLCPGR